MSPHALYLHIPFCQHRCAYCDFNTYAGLDALIEPYIRALILEIEQLGLEFVGEISSIYLGGGTPSLVPPRLLDQVLTSIGHSFRLQPDIEISLEANPGTLTSKVLTALRASGFNRISIGMQSANPNDLRILERNHDIFDVVRAVREARAAGFDNLSLDLIFGLPYQDLDRWVETLETAVRFEPDHFSIYSLILEDGTPMNNWVARGLLPASDDDLAAEMYEITQQLFSERSYLQYEISNWAKATPGGELKACQHNLQYWRNLPYFGLGAGAHGYVNGIRTANVRSPKAYIERFETSTACEFPRSAACSSTTSIDRAAEMGETMMMGLRLIQEGISNQRFSARFGANLQDEYGDLIREFEERGLLEWKGDSLRLTPRGVLFGNQVFIRFI